MKPVTFDARRYELEHRDCLPLPNKDGSAPFRFAITNKPRMRRLGEVNNSILSPVDPTITRCGEVNNLESSSPEGGTFGDGPRGDVLPIDTAP